MVGSLISFSWQLEYHVLPFDIGVDLISLIQISCADPEGWVGQGVRTPPLKKHKNIGFLSNAGPEPLKNYKATKLAFNGGPSSPASETPFRWRTDNDPVLVVPGPSLPLIKK